MSNKNDGSALLMLNRKERRRIHKRIPGINKPYVASQETWKEYQKRTAPPKKHVSIPLFGS